MQGGSHSTFWAGGLGERHGEKTEPGGRQRHLRPAAAAPKYVTTCQRGRNRSCPGSGRGVACGASEPQGGQKGGGREGAGGGPW